MNRPALTSGTLDTGVAALLRRLLEQLKTSPTPFHGAPFISLLFEQLANGACPNELFAWRPAAGGGLDPYYRALLDAYLDHLVFAEVDTADAQQVNQLLQDILDGAEPDRVLGFVSREPQQGATPSRARRVVYAFKVLQQLAADGPSSATRESAATPDPGRVQNAVELVAWRCNLSPQVVEEAFADQGILGEARRLLALQSGLSPGMQRAALQESPASGARPGDDLARGYAQAWWERNRRDE